MSHPGLIGESILPMTARYIKIYIIIFYSSKYVLQLIDELTIKALITLYPKYFLKYNNQI